MNDFQPPISDRVVIRKAADYLMSHTPASLMARLMVKCRATNDCSSEDNQHNDKNTGCAFSQLHPIWLHQAGRVTCHADVKVTCPNSTDDYLIQVIGLLPKTSFTLYPASATPASASPASTEKFILQRQDRLMCRDANLNTFYQGNETTANSTVTKYRNQTHSSCIVNHQVINKTHNIDKHAYCDVEDTDKNSPSSDFDLSQLNHYQSQQHTCTDLAEFSHIIQQYLNAMANAIPIPDIESINEQNWSAPFRQESGDLSPFFSAGLMGFIGYDVSADALRCFGQGAAQPPSDLAVSIQSDKNLIDTTHIECDRTDPSAKPVFLADQPLAYLADYDIYLCFITPATVGHDGAAIYDDKSVKTQAGSHPDSKSNATMTSGRWMLCANSKHAEDLLPIVETWLRNATLDTIKLEDNQFTQEHKSEQDCASKSATATATATATAKQTISSANNVINSHNATQNARISEQPWQSAHQTNRLKLAPVWQAETYQQAFARTQAYLYAGDSYQVNLTQCWRGRLSSGQTLASFLPVLTHATNAPYAGYLALPHFELLTCSPELFIQFCHNSSKPDEYDNSTNIKLITKPIKGTRPRNKTADLDMALLQSLSTSDKDKAENVMIVDLLRNDLGKFARTGTVQVPKLFAIESFSNVHHMVSTITADLRSGISSWQVLIGSLPAGSVTGAPKKRSVEIIHELEALPRGAYCGSMGYLNADGTGEWNVLIRTLQADAQGNVHLWAGGGITISSECDAEYQECWDKVGNILAILENGM